MDGPLGIFAAIMCLIYSRCLTGKLFCLYAIILFSVHKTKMASVFASWLLFSINRKDVVRLFDDFLTGRNRRSNLADFINMRGFIYYAL